MNIILSFALALAILSANAQTNNTMNGNRLSQRQLNLAVCACLEAQGNMEKLDAAIRKALDEGVTVNELKEAFSQLYAYTGFPRSLNAVNQLKSVLDDRRAKGIHNDEGTPWKRPVLWDNAAEVLKHGTEVQTRLCGGVPYNLDFCPQNDYYLKSHLFGDIFASDILSEADREIVTVAALSGMKGVEKQLASHKRGAVAMGNTTEQVEELCRYLSNNGLSQGDNAAEINIGTWPKGEPNTAYDKYFNGKSYLARISDSQIPIANVTFEPACRNNWHIHHATKGGGQMLVGVVGRGWYQEKGKPAQEILPGTVIHIPANVKHWHGAATDSWFSHLACEVTGENTSTEWLEPVSDEEYNKLNK